MDFKRFIPDIRFIAFLAVFLLVLIAGIDPRLMYHGYGLHGAESIQFRSFNPGVEFFMTFASCPGGMLEYVSAFLSQFYYYLFSGSVIITLTIAALCFITKKIMKHLGGPDYSVLYFVPALLLLVGYNQLLDHISFIAGLSAALSLSLLYIRLGKAGAVIRGIVFLVSLVALYYTTGLFFIAFAVITGLYEIITKRRLSSGGVIIAISALLPFALNRLVFNYSLIYSIRTYIPSSGNFGWYKISSIALWALYFYYPLLSLFYQIREKINSSSSTRSSGSHKPNKKTAGAFSRLKSLRYFARGKRRIISEIVLLTVITVAVAVGSYGVNYKRMFRINYLSRQEKWEELLSVAGKVPLKYYNSFINHEINKALFFTGRISSDLFTYPQKLEGFISPAYVNMEMISRGETYCHLGFINHAERQASEALELVGDHPEILRQLFYVNMAKGNTGSARMYLNKLCKDLIYGKWARSVRDSMEKDPQLSKDAMLSKMRSVKTADDHIRFWHPLEDRVDELFAENGDKMAFDFMMAIYLLSRQIEPIIQNLHYFDEFNNGRIPRHYQEALVIYIMETKDKYELGELKIEREIMQNSKNFLRDVKLNGAMAKSALKDSYGDSYYYYYMFNSSGLNR